MWQYFYSKGLEFSSCLFHMMSHLVLSSLRERHWGINPHSSTALIWQKCLLSLFHPTRPALQLWWRPGGFKQASWKLAESVLLPLSPSASASHSSLSVTALWFIHSCTRERKINSFWKKNELASCHEERRKKREVHCKFRGDVKVEEAVPGICRSLHFTASLAVLPPNNSNLKKLKKKN